MDALVLGADFCRYSAKRHSPQIMILPENHANIHLSVKVSCNCPFVCHWQKILPTELKGILLIRYRTIDPLKGSRWRYRYWINATVRKVFSAQENRNSKLLEEQKTAGQAWISRLYGKEIEDFLQNLRSKSWSNSFLGVKEGEYSGFISKNWEKRSMSFEQIGWRLTFRALPVNSVNCIWFGSLPTKRVN